MSTATIRIALLAALFANATEGVAANALGRLFFTAEQREVLERQRRLGRQTPVPMRLDGIVAASDKRVVAWIDGQPRHASDHTEWRIQVSRRNPSQATVAAPGDSPFALHVGERIDRATESKTDLLPTHALRVDRNPR